MAREEQAVFTVLILVTDPEGRILVEDRVDERWKGLCLPGGHVEKSESFTEAAIRETLEETGLLIEAPRLCGVKQFQTKTDARYVVFFYKSDRYTGTIHSSEEGEVFWVSREQLKEHRCVVDLEKMLEVFDRDDLSEFQYYKQDGKFELRLF